MAQIQSALYNTIAQAYALIDDALSGISTNARAALDAIVNVDDLYPVASAPDPDAALEIELALLATFNGAYVASQNIENSNSSLLDAVVAVNDFVIKEQLNTTNGTTAKLKLDYFINTQMADWWDTGFVPSGWKDICTDAGYNTTDWNLS